MQLRDRGKKAGLGGERGPDESGVNQKTETASVKGTNKERTYRSASEPGDARVSLSMSLRSGGLRYAVEKDVHSRMSSCLRCSCANGRRLESKSRER